MPLYEFKCLKCAHEFEQITTLTAENAGDCPQCGTKKAERKLSSFAISGRGDQRESTTFHGCHTDSGLTPHKHGPGCGH